MHRAIKLLTPFARAHISSTSKATQYRGYIPPEPLKFDTSDRYHLYHCEEGEKYVRILTRTNVLFLAGNSVLYIMELTSPFFGYWHGVALLSTVLLNLIGARMLHYYSSRMVNNMWLHRDGKTVEVEFMNAFLLPENRTF